MKSNAAVRQAAERNCVCLWQVAQRLGIHESTLCRRLRVELPPEEQNRLLSIIDELSKGES